MHHIIVVNKQKNELKKQSKANFRSAIQFARLKLYRKHLGIIKGKLQKKNISKRSILINKIKEIFEDIVELFVTRLQRCIELEGDRTGY